MTTDPENPPINQRFRGSIGGGGATAAARLRIIVLPLAHGKLSYTYNAIIISSRVHRASYIYSHAEFLARLEFHFECANAPPPRRAGAWDLELKHRALARF